MTLLNYWKPGSEFYEKTRKIQEKILEKTKKKKETENKRRRKKIEFSWGEEENEET